MHIFAKTLVACAAVGTVLMLACQSDSPAPDSATVAPNATQAIHGSMVTPDSDFNVLRSTTALLLTPSPTPESDELRPRKVFRVPISNILVPDPVFADFGESSTLQYEIFAGLTRFTLDATDPVRLDMAANHSVSRDWLTHTFVLHEGLKFSDGTHVTASDFKWSWERALRTAAKVNVATQAEWVLAPIRGTKEVLSGEASELSGVEAVDETTLTIKLIAPRSDLEALLAHPSAAVLKRENVEGWSVDWSTSVFGSWIETSSSGRSITPDTLPVGTGPFALTRFDEINGIFIVERNDHYHGEPPQLDAVRFDASAVERAFDDPDGLNAAFAKLFVNGDIDVVHSPWKLVDDAGVEVPHNLSRGAGNPGTTVLVFNPSIPPFDDLNFRRALAASIDRESIDHPFEVDDATGIVAPESPGYSESSSLIAYDIVAAKASFDAFSQSSPGPIDPIPWAYWFGGLYENRRAQIVAGWEQVLSLEFELGLEPPDRYQTMRAANELAIVIQSHAATYPHPQSSVIDFREIFGDAMESDEIDAVEAMASVAASEPDPVIALRLYAELEQHLIDSALVVPLWANLGVGYTVAVQPWIHDYQEGRYGGSRFKDVWFDDSYPGPR